MTKTALGVTLKNKEVYSPLSKEISKRYGPIFRRERAIYTPLFLRAYLMLTISARSSFLSINIAISSKEKEAGYITSCNFNKRTTQTQERESV
jgi:hypothetical protein